MGTPEPQIGSLLSRPPSSATFGDAACSASFHCYKMAICSRDILLQSNHKHSIGSTQCGAYPINFCRQMLRIDRNIHWAQFYLPLLVLNALVFHVTSSTFPALSPRYSHERIWDSFAPDSSAPAAAASSLSHPASNLDTRSTCPPFNASAPQIQLSTPLENQIVHCGGSQEYLYTINGSCSSDLFSMVVITVQDNSSPYAAVDISLFAPLPLNSTTYASRSPNRRYYMMQLLTTCPGM
jgi:hypothetical protein